MTDAENGNIMDIIVAQAAREAADELGGGTEPAARADAPVMTPKARRKILRMIERRPLPLHLKIMRAAACITLIAFVGLGGTVMSVEALREKFISYVFDKNAPDTEFFYQFDEEDTDEYMKLNFIPHGFKCTDYSISIDMHTEYFNFVNGDDWFDISLIGRRGTPSLDTENAELEEIEINGYDAVFISKTTHNAIIWHDENNLFHMAGSISKETMVKIASNVSMEPIFKNMSDFWNLKRF